MAKQPLPTKMCAHAAFYLPTATSILTPGDKSSMLMLNHWVTVVLCQGQSSLSRPGAPLQAAASLVLMESDGRITAIKHVLL